jgi:hypothetical protein
MEADMEARWNRDVVKAMFNKAAHPNIDRYFEKVEAALDEAIKDKKISDLEQIRKLKLYTYATVATENASFNPAPEKQGRSNTLSHHAAPPRQLGEQVAQVHSVHEALLDQFKIDNPYGKYDYKRMQKISAEAEADALRHGYSKDKIAALRDQAKAPRGLGERYRGRGWIQLTGMNNYLYYGVHAKCPQIVEDPDQASNVENAARLLAAYVLMNFKRILTALDANDLRAAREVVNGKAAAGAEPHGMGQFSHAYKIGLQQTEEKKLKTSGRIRGEAAPQPFE